MALINDVKAVLNRLAPRGWTALFAAHGLDIMVPLAGLTVELGRSLIVDRTRLGFEEFAFDGHKAVEPGIPGRSLLYHALASPYVIPEKATSGPADFPTLAELDTVENYIYSLARRKLTDFANPVVGVFAYQYRETKLSPHRRHADLAFSRCGVARIGTEVERYDPAARSFDPRSAAGDRGFAVLPAHYGVFIAEYRTPSASDQVLRGVAADGSQTFLFPIHKLFAGTECLFHSDGTPLSIPTLKFSEFHLDEKLKRLHTAGPDNPGRIPPLPIFDLTKPPFSRDSTNTNLVSLKSVGDGVWVMPVPSAIVKTATQTVKGVAELARFKVPKENSTNRFWTSLQVTSTPNGRAAPEYANIRQEAVPKPAGGFSLNDLNKIPDTGTSPANRFERKLATGGYLAAHLIDGTCDGVINVALPPVLGTLQAFPAFSLVAAVDYFPQVEQVEITEWIEEQTSTPIGLGDPGFLFPQGGPAPLSDGRFAVSQSGTVVKSNRIPNVDLKNANGIPQFPPLEAASNTVTAVVGRAATSGAQIRKTSSGLVATWLPDAASDVFAPGWDVSQHIVDGRGTYVTYGLGSPFPEDAKLCAALNSFWPAAAPDSSRTFGFQPGATGVLQTSLPLTDGELGYNKKHPRVIGGEVAANIGWDGETGPFFVTTAGGTIINAASAARSDQSRQALDGNLGFSGLDLINTTAFIERLAALRFVKGDLPHASPPQSDPWLVTVEAVADWTVWASAGLPKLSAALSGSGLLFSFAYVDPAPTPSGDPALRLEFKVLRTVIVHVDATQGFFKDGNGPVRRVARS